MIPQTDLIDRWEHAELVLDTLPEHDRQAHWDMSKWGRLTDCGTVACAAGHCGLNPWFRERGFKLDFSRSGEPEISDVKAFFGLEGSSRIFFDSTLRTVETVIEEVHGYIGELRTVAKLLSKSAVAIGEVWPEQGGVFAGVSLGRNGSPHHFLIIGSEFDGRLNWPDAMKWAAGLSIDGFADYTLSFRREQTLEWDNVRSLFRSECYWSCEQRPGRSYFAYVQYFNGGSQGYTSKGSLSRARAVRRIPIQ